MGKAEAGAAGPCQPVICNLGTSTGFSNRDVVAAAERVVGHAIKHRIGPRRAGDPAVLIASSARAGELLGWRAQHETLEEIVGSAWEWRRRGHNGR